MDKKEYYYLVFVLGYDLMQEQLKNSEESECDLVFEKCIEIIDKFYVSEEIKNYKWSSYEALREFIKNNKEVE